MLEGEEDRVSVNTGKKHHPLRTKSVTINCQEELVTGFSIQNKHRHTQSTFSENDNDTLNLIRSTVLFLFGCSEFGHILNVAFSGFGICCGHVIMCDHNSGFT